MSLKLLFSSFGCVLAWMVLLPIGLIGGGLALVTYAVFAEVSDRVTGAERKRIDPSTARSMARQMLHPRHSRLATGL